MSEPSSPRVSSRLAYKKQHRNWKDDIFEYTPLTSCHKKTANKAAKGLTYTKSPAGDYQKTTNTVSPVLSNKRRRGRPPKIKTQQSVGSKKHRANCEGEPQQALLTSPTSISQNELKHKPGNRAKHFLNKVHADLYLLAKHLVENDSLQHTEEDKVFSVVAALLHHSQVRGVPITTLEQVAKDSGIVLVECKEGDNLLFGDLENLIQARQELLTVMKQHQSVNDLIIKKESNRDRNNLSPDEDRQDEDAVPDLETSNVNNTGEVDVDVASRSEAEHSGHTSVTTQAADADSKLNIPADFNAEEKDSLNDTSTNDGSLTGVDGAEAKHAQDLTKNDMNNASTEQRLSEMQTDLESSGYECIGIIDSSKSTSYVSNRQGPKRRQGKCKHMKESCDICTSYCKLCQYRSTEVAVKKHMLRVHPTTTYDCEVCGMQFGIRYDMRRHRMLHFDDNGSLNKEAKTFLRQNNKAELLSLTLADLEMNFVAKAPATPEMAAGGADGDRVIKSEFSMNGMVSADEQSSACVVKADPDDGEVLCGFCDNAGSLDSVLLHHRSRHKVPDSANLAHLCPVCGQPFSPDEFRHHYLEVCARENGSEKDLVNIRASCRLCQMNGPLKAIKAHVEDHPEKLLCKICQCSGDAEMMEAHVRKCSRSLKKPRKLHTRNPPKESLVLYRCGICSNIFKTRASLQMHFKCHEVDKVYKCEACDFQTTRPGLLNAHLRKKHASLEQRRCDICSKVFNQVTSLRFHKESVHGIGRTTHRCQHCSKVFSTKRFLQVHIKRVHFGIKSYFCSVCKKGFFERARMLDHENVHLLPSERAKKKHVCSFCGKAYSQKSILRQHENTHQGLRPYKCNQCDKSFAFTAQLHKHKVAHRTERPHICIHCGKGFKFPYKLTAHIVTHTKQGRHSCTTCNKVYTSRSSLHKHMYHACSVPKNRLANRQFCTRCDRMFASVGELRKHQCQGVDSDGLFIMSEKDMESQALMAQTAAEESVQSSNNVLHILGAESDSQMVPAESEVIMLTSEAMQDIGTAVEPLENEKLVVENIKSVFVGEELAQSSVLYMCCVCNKLFSEQNEVNVHMELEHEAEAVIAQDACSETQQAIDTDRDNLTSLYNLAGDNSIVITATADDGCLTNDTVNTAPAAVSGINGSIITLDGTVTMITREAAVESSN